MSMLSLAPHLSLSSCHLPHCSSHRGRRGCAASWWLPTRCCPACPPKTWPTLGGRPPAGICGPAKQHTRQHSRPRSHLLVACLQRPGQGRMRPRLRLQVSQATWLQQPPRARPSTASSQPLMLLPPPISSALPPAPLPPPPSHPPALPPPPMPLALVPPPPSRPCGS